MTMRRESGMGARGDPRLGAYTLGVASRHCRTRLPFTPPPSRDKAAVLDGGLVTQTDGAPARAVGGIEAAAFVLSHAVDTYAVVGGDGARRLRDALAAAGGPTRIPGDGLAAARGAIGAAAAGKRTALVVSGESVLEVLPAISEMARLGLPAVLVVPSHGADAGASAPADGLHDVALLTSLPIGVLVASESAQVAEFLMAALRAAADRGAPWAVAFELAGVGLTLANARIPDATQVREWMREVRPGGAGKPLEAAESNLERYQREVERFGFALGAAMRDLERRIRRAVSPIIVEGARDAELVTVAMGAAARSARQALPALSMGGIRHVAALQIASLRPFPAAEIVRLAWRARAVIVHEPLPEPLGAGGRLSEAVRASFADALTWHPAFAGIGRIPPVVTLLGSDVSPEQWLSAVRTVAAAGDPPRLVATEGSSRRGGAAEGRIEIAMDESVRDAALRLVVEWLARSGIAVSAHAYEPTRAGIAIARGGSSRGPQNVLLVCPAGVYDISRLDALAPGTLVVLAGDFPDRVLGRRQCGLEPRAGSAWRPCTLKVALPLRNDAAIVAVVRTMVPGESSEDRALEAAVRDLNVREPEVILAQVRAFSDSLRAQFG